MDVYTPKWKLEFKNTSLTRGQFTITVPTSIHKAFCSFTSDIEKQILASDFLPPSCKERQIVWQTGRADIKTNSYSLTPDGSISMFGPRDRFLILEVAHSRREKDVLRKAQTYLLDTNQQIRIVVLVIVHKKPLPRSRIADAEKLCAETDGIHVYVCKYVQKPEYRTMEYVVERLQIFPGPIPEETFEIAWSDVNSGSWSRARDGMGLPADAPQPVCHVNFHDLYWTAMSLSGYVKSVPWVPSKDAVELKKVDYLTDL
jgi:hypothetical protein